MEEFLTKLYSYEYFSTYLIISIIVLIFLFIVILCFGKKDQKKREIEATKKLMQINEEAINDQFVMEENNKTKEDVLENDTIIVPNIGDINLDNNVILENNDEEIIPEPVLPEVSNDHESPVIEDTPIVNINEENAFKEESAPEVVEVPKQEEFEYPEFNTVNNINEPVLSSNEEKPFEFDDFNFNGDVISPKLPETNGDAVKETKEETIPVKEELKVPEFDFNKIVRNVEEVSKEETKRGPEIFSSVYAPVKEDVKESNQKAMESDDEEFDLPTLKKDVENETEDIDIPKLNDYNLDKISGETYNIR